VKSLDRKLADLRADPRAADAFILADAKDADTAFGLAAPGVDPLAGRRRSLAEFRDQIREIVAHLARLRIKPTRPLKQNLQLTERTVDQ